MQNGGIDKQSDLERLAARDVTIREESDDMPPLIQVCLKWYLFSHSCCSNINRCGTLLKTV